MSTVQDEFLRRYATSPMHVARLERLLAVYGTGGAGDDFAAAFIAWDRAANDSDAARIVSEVLSTLQGDDGRLVRLTGDAIRGAITWLADAPADERGERAEALALILSEITRPSGTGREREPQP